jgi:tetratricopeptide (TPR) repeat protein
MAEAHYWLGRSRLSLNRYEDASRSLEQAIKLNPNYAEAHSELGTAYEQLKRTDEAVTAYRRALEADPEYFIARIHLGHLYTKLKRFVEARAEYTVLAKRSNPNAPMLETEINRAERRDIAERQVQQKPDDPGALTELGFATMEGESWVLDDRFERARDIFLHALRIDPGHIQAHVGVGICYVELGDKKSAGNAEKVLETLDKQSAAALAKRIKQGPSRTGIRVRMPDK